MFRGEETRFLWERGEEVLLQSNKSLYVGRLHVSSGGS